MQPPQPRGLDRGPYDTPGGGSAGLFHRRAVTRSMDPVRKTTTRRRRPMAAIVAGGAGFLGSHLCDRLIEDGFQVFCVDSLYTGLPQNIEHLADEPRFVFVEHDVRTPLPAFANVEEVYNLACPASPPHYQMDPIHTVTTNVLGTLNLVDLAAARGARFLFASTSEVYGDPEVHPQREDYRGSVNTTGPRACYDEGKRVAEALCSDYVRKRQADVRICRIFNTYGPRMRADDGRIVSNLITQALSGRPMTIYGNGEQTRSFCYVSDMVEGLRRLMRVETPPPSPVNLGNPEEFKMIELANLVTQLTGSNVPVTYHALPQDDPKRRRPDIALATELLRWKPTVPLRSGLGPTVDWFARTTEHRLPLRAVAPRESREPSGLAQAPIAGSSLSD